MFLFFLLKVVVAWRYIELKNKMKKRNFSSRVDYSNHYISQIVAGAWLLCWSMLETSILDCQRIYRVTVK